MPNAWRNQEVRARERVEIPNYKTDVDVPFARAPHVELPRGGGAIRGIGESLKTNTFTGTSTLSIPVPAPPGRAGFGPELVLRYDSGGGNGPFGLGFKLGLPEIRRQTERGLPQYDDRDTFVLVGADELVIARGPDGAPLEWSRSFEGRVFRVTVLRPRSDGAFSRIERWTDVATKDAFFVVRTAENVTHVFGERPEARIFDPADRTKVFSWLLEASYDGRGNIIAYRHAAEDGVGLGARVHDRRRTPLSVSAQRYPKRVLYGNRTPLLDFAPGRAPSSPSDFLLEIVFDYGDHGEIAPSPEPSEPWTTRPDPFSVYRPGFELRTLRRCRRILCFHRFPELGPEPTLVRSLELAYGYSPRLSLLERATIASFERRGAGYARGEIPSLELDYTSGDLGGPVTEVRAEELVGLPAGLSAPVQWIDLEGDGLPGALTEIGAAAYFKRNLGQGRMAAPVLLKEMPPAEDGYRLLDLGADGGLDWVMLSGSTRGAYERKETGGWKPFLPFEGTPSIDLTQPHVHFIDLDGDGRADLLVAEDELALWHPSRGRRGFDTGRRVHWSDPAEQPELVSIDQRQAIFIADMSGDGLADVVRVRSGEITYWPNLGHGKFGPAIRMSAAPHLGDDFDPRRVRLADVDGTGPADLVYLDEGSAHLFLNEAGNGFGQAITLPFPRVDSLSSVQVVDLEGTGTACLVWSSNAPGHEGRSLRYVDLLRGQKPHLLRRIQNNLGLETRIRYAPSTRFSLEDRLAGRPWLTRLPMIVHVVEREEVFDRVQRTRLVRRYRYRHGHYDRAERELAGFGFVEQWDAETFGVRGEGLFSPGANEALGTELHAPPVRTCTWFATGAEHDPGYREGVVREFYEGVPQRLELVAPWGDESGDERRDAGRALRGRMLRVETYAEDGSSEAEHPYEVRQASPVTRMLQPRRAGAPSCQLAFDREVLSVHLERSPADARVEHDFVLEVDAFGNALRSAHVAYPRGGATLPEQASPLSTVEAARFANRADRPDGYRVRVPVETIRYELVGLGVETDRLVSFEALDSAIRGALAGAAPTDPAGARLSRVAAARHLFYREDLSGELPLGEVDPRSLPYESFHAAFSAAHLAEHVAPVLPVAVLEAEGGYRMLDGELWIATGRTTYDPSRFHAPVRITEPTGNAVRIEHDRHTWFPARITSSDDALLASQISAEHDYRALSPKLVTDANGNVSAAAFDVLGLVSRVALLGKPGGEEGDTLDDPTLVLTYDALAWQREGRPAWAKTAQRSFHRSSGAPARWEIAINYTDGFGKAALKKVLAEPEAAGGPPGWIGTGRTTRDNKGRVIKQYEPYVSATDAYEDEDTVRTQGVTPIHHHDPLGRLIRTEHPDGTESRVEFGVWSDRRHEPNDLVSGTPWFAEHRDAVDPREWRAALASRAHEGTPTVEHKDPLGRAFLSIADNGERGPLSTRTVLDIEGHPLEVRDPVGRTALKTVFDLLGRPLRVETLDGGVRVLVLDARCAALRQHRIGPDGAEVIGINHDRLRRPIRVWTERGGRRSVAERIVWGEFVTGASARNLRTQAHAHYDAAGVVIREAYDLHGKVTELKRRFTAAFATDPDWGVLDAAADAGAAATAAEPFLLTGAFVKELTHDAMGRVVRQRSLGGPLPSTALDLPGSAQSFARNVRGLLESVTLDQEDTTRSVVERIHYDARGERTRIRYGNGVETAYTRDPRSLRLIRQRSVRADGTALTDTRYFYDASGNVVQIDDDGDTTELFGHELPAFEKRYVYDAVNRLVAATGVEHPDQLGQPGADDTTRIAHPNDLQALVACVESYDYDAAGNLREMKHRAGSSGWTRTYLYEAGSNRLEWTSVPGDRESIPSSPLPRYAHDRWGNMTAMIDRVFHWDPFDRLREVDLGGGGKAYYQYDASGERVRKVIERLGGVREERFYLGGREVHRRTVGGTLDRVSETVHVMDDRRRVALIESVVVKDGAPVSSPPLLRYQLDDHLGSAVLELDGAGRVLTYEAYHPYGSTAFRTAPGGLEVADKRYRYNGKERDDETGLHYYGARYYAAWLGRWTACDPEVSLNPFVYASCGPSMRIDPTGRQDSNVTLRPEVPIGTQLWKGTGDAAENALTSMTPIGAVQHIANWSRHAASHGGGAWGHFMSTVELVGKLNPFGTFLTAALGGMSRAGAGTAPASEAIPHAGPVAATINAIDRHDYRGAFATWLGIASPLLLSLAAKAIPSKSGGPDSRQNSSTRMSTTKEPSTVPNAAAEPVIESGGPYRSSLGTGVPGAHEGGISTSGDGPGTPGMRPAGGGNSPLPCPVPLWPEGAVYPNISEGAINAHAAELLMWQDKIMEGNMSIQGNPPVRVTLEAPGGRTLAQVNENLNHVYHTGMPKTYVVFPARVLNYSSIIISCEPYGFHLKGRR